MGDKEKKETKEDEDAEKIEKTGKKFNDYFCYIVHFGFIISIAIVLGIDDSTCDTPIREWLIVWATVAGFSLILLSLTFVKTIKKGKRACIVCLYSLSFPFFISWIVVGSIWLYTSDNCYDDFYNGWALTLSILIVSYTGIGLVCIFCGVLAVLARKVFKKVIGFEKLEDVLEFLENNKEIMEILKNIEKQKLKDEGSNKEAKFDKVESLLMKGKGIKDILEVLEIDKLLSDKGAEKIVENEVLRTIIEKGKEMKELLEQYQVEKLMIKEVVKNAIGKENIEKLEEKGKGIKAAINNVETLIPQNIKEVFNNKILPGLSEV